MENSIRQKYEQFESLICKIFEAHDYEVTNMHSAMRSENHPVNNYDLLAEKSESRLAIEVKYSKMKFMRSDMICNTAFRLNDAPSNIQPIIVLSGVISIELRKKMRSFERVKFIDIGNLLYLVASFPNLKDELLNLLEFSTTDISVQKPEIFSINNLFIVNEDSNIIDTLIYRLENWSTATQTSVEYERICIESLKQLFSDELALWRKQAISNDALYRFDLICKIKDSVENGLWTFLQNFFNTKYVIFEFKNYIKPISQKEIYTTEKYIYSKALRGVAIIISCEGESANAQKAIRGVLRETGKLILSIKNDDLIKMLKSKQNNDIPSDCLYEMLDDMLVDLEK